MLNYMQTPPIHYYLESSGQVTYMKTHPKSFYIFTMILNPENGALFMICHRRCKPGETAVEPVQRSEMSVKWEFPAIRGFPLRCTETQLLLTSSDRHIISNTSHPTLHVQGKKIGKSLVHEQEMHLLPHWPFTGFQ